MNTSRSPRAPNFLSFLRNASKSGSVDGADKFVSVSFGVSGKPLACFVSRASFPCFSSGDRGGIINLIIGKLIQGVILL